MQHKPLNRFGKTHIRGKKLVSDLYTREKPSSMAMIVFINACLSITNDGFAAVMMPTEAAMARLREAARELGRERAGGDG